MNRDKWGYPRPWKWWGDWMFWLVTIMIFISWAQTFLTGSIYAVRSSQLFMIYVSWYAVSYAVVYWYMYDSYRWEHPYRWGWLIGLAIAWPLVLPFFIMRRREYLVFFERRRNKPY